MKVVELSGGVGGARMARGLAAVPGVELTVIVNVGDDATNHGLRISPDLDTVIYTLAGVEGPHGWGRAGDTFALNDELARFGVSNVFRLGDRDMALKLFRTERMAHGSTLTEVTEVVAGAFGLGPSVTPVTDDELRTEVRVEEGWISFQEYFVDRKHRDEVLELRYAGAETAHPAPGVIQDLELADVIVIGPSNPPLSIWPILAVPGIRQAVADHPRVVAVSPLIGGKAVRGPADAVMASLGLAPGNVGVVEAYQGLLSLLVVSREDAADADTIEDVEMILTDTRIIEPAPARRLAEEILAL